MAANIDLTDVGGTPVTLVGADPNDPNAVAWNFGLEPTTPAVVAAAGPQLENRFPNIRGRWDGRPINHHEAVRKVLTNDLKAHRQSAGTCGGHAGSRGTELLQCVMIATGKRAKYKPVSHAWPYFLARREFNMLGRGDGVASGSIPPVLGKYGALHREESGDAYESGSSVDDLAVRWGAGRMSSADRERLLGLANDNPVTQMVQVKSAAELADGLSAGGIAICSDDQGYSMTRDRDGFCAPRGTWYHYHVRSGIVVTAGGRKGFAYDQSWGETIPDGPLLPGYPPNCFGVDWDVQDRLCRTGDVHVLFGFDLWELEQGSIDIPWWI